MINPVTTQEVSQTGNEIDQPSLVQSQHWKDFYVKQRVAKEAIE